MVGFAHEQVVGMCNWRVLRAAGFLWLSMLSLILVSFAIHLLMLWLLPEQSWHIHSELQHTTAFANNKKKQPLPSLWSPLCEHVWFGKDPGSAVSKICFQRGLGFYRSSGHPGKSWPLRRCTQHVRVKHVIVQFLICHCDYFKSCFAPKTSPTLGFYRVWPQSG